MKGTVNEWKQAIEHAEENAQAYEDKQHSGNRLDTPQFKGTEFRRQAWNLVAASIAEALRLEALPVHQS